jgi:hypothetical protein
VRGHRRADGCEQVAEYGRRNEAFFRRFLALAHGIPSHDAFYGVFAALDPSAFAQRPGGGERRPPVTAPG